jgi:hypothetical protein
LPTRAPCFTDTRGHASYLHNTPTPLARSRSVSRLKAFGNRDFRARAVSE